MLTTLLTFLDNPFSANTLCSFGSSYTDFSTGIYWWNYFDYRSFSLYHVGIYMGKECYVP